MNGVEALPKRGVARFGAARAATDIFDSGLLITLDEASTDPHIVRQLYDLPIPSMTVRGLGGGRQTGSTAIEFSGSAPDEEASVSDFDTLDELQTLKGQIRRQITALRRGGGLPYSERLANRLDFLLSALEEEIEEEEETWAEGSPDSLWQMLLFLRTAPDLRYPTVTITPSATFRAQWQADRNSHFAVDFLPDGQVRFVVFSPDPHHPDRVQRVSGIVGRADVLRAIEPFRAHRWAADAGA
jgi:hypothetical protein